MYAVKEMQEALGGQLGFNVAFVFEGEEENGSKVLSCSVMLSMFGEGVCCHVQGFVYS